MQNEMRFIYDEMCDNCKKTFRKIIMTIRNDKTKDLNNLALFFCDINGEVPASSDKGVRPVALINCTLNKYAFFWKTNLLDQNGDPKIPIIDSTITLSQETIDKIPKPVRPSQTIMPKQQSFDTIEKIVEPQVDVAQKKFAQTEFIQDYEKKVEAKPIESDNQMVAVANNQGETLQLVKKLHRSSNLSTRKMIHTLNRKTSTKIWIILITMFLCFTGVGIGGWRLFVHLNDQGSNTIIQRTDITGISQGMLTNQRVIIDNNVFSQDPKLSHVAIYDVLDKLAVGPKQQDFHPILKAAIKDSDVRFTIDRQSFKEDGGPYSIRINIDATLSKKYTGKISVMITALSKFVLIGQLNIDWKTFKKGTVNSIIKPTSADVVDAIKVMTKDIAFMEQLSKPAQELLKEAADWSNSKHKFKVVDFVGNLTAQKSVPVDIRIEMQDDGPNFRGAINIPVDVQVP